MHCFVERSCILLIIPLLRHAYLFVLGINFVFLLCVCVCDCRIILLCVTVVTIISMLTILTNLKGNLMGKSVNSRTPLFHTQS